MSTHFFKKVCKNPESPENTAKKFTPGSVKNDRIGEDRTKKTAGNVVFAFNRKRWYNDVVMTTKARMKANTRYENKAIDKITFRLRKDGKSGVTRAEIQQAAANAKTSVNDYVLRAVMEKMSREK